MTTVMNEVADYFGKTGFIFVKYDVIIKVLYCNLLWWETLYEFYWKFSIVSSGQRILKIAYDFTKLPSYSLINLLNSL